jgi:hypothetical protein
MSTRGNCVNCGKQYAEHEANNECPGNPYPNQAYKTYKERLLSDNPTPLPINKEQRPSTPPITFRITEQQPPPSLLIVEKLDYWVLTVVITLGVGLGIGFGSALADIIGRIVALR